MNIRRRLIFVAASALGVNSLRVAAQSPSIAVQSFPNRPVRLIVPQPPGSAPDIRSRQIAQRLSEEWQQPVVVDNRPGASGAIAMELVVRAPPDGYTMVMANSIGLGSLPHLTKVPYDALKDFAAVTKVSSGPFILVAHPGVPFNTVSELISHARANPGKLNAATAGIGSTQHLLFTLMNKDWSIALTSIPYKGGAQTVSDLVAGQVQLTLDFASVIGPHLKSGRLKALALSSDTRLAVLPEVPTFKELGYAGMQFTAWQGLIAPAGTPREIVARLNSGVVKVLNLPEIRDAFVSTGSEVGGDSPEQFAAFIRAEHARWGKVVSDAGIRLE